MIDEIQLPPELQAGTNLNLLTEDFAKWISHSNPRLPLSKLGLLCTTNFQVIAGQVLKALLIKEISLIKDFRILIWTTTLAYTANPTDT